MNPKKSRFQGKAKSSFNPARYANQGNHTSSQGTSKRKLVCYRCGEEHKGNESGFSGICDNCGAKGHKSIVCQKNPKYIIPSGVLNKYKSSVIANQLSYSTTSMSQDRGKLF